MTFLRRTLRHSIQLFAFTSALFLFTGHSQAQTMTIPEIGALLPPVVDVKPTQPTAVDGLWTISSLDKLVRIDRGRAYAIEGWLHLFVLKIKPGMVVIKDFTEDAPGIYSAQDLPLQGPLKATLTGDRILDVTVAGAMGEVRYQMIPRELDEPEAFKALIKEVRAAGR